MNGLSRFDWARARVNFDRLVDLLSGSCFNATDSFLQELKNNQDFHIDLFKEEPAACKAIEDFAIMVHEAKLHRCPLGDPGLVYNLSAMLYVLLQIYGDRAASERTLNALQVAHAAVLSEYLKLAMEQADAVCRFILHVVVYFRSLSLGNARLFLVDLPVGNSVPVRLICQMMQEFAHVEILRASLSRNDSRRQGITRRELLEEKMREASLCAGDVVLYLDEWNTGVNFHTMCEILRRAIQPECFFFPAAFLAADSTNQLRYPSFCADHNRFLKSWGKDGSEFRVVLPPVQSVMKGGGYFFWSENDRMAGFRKMQLHGSIFSSMDETVEFLHRNAEALDVAVALQLGELAQITPLPGTAQERAVRLRELFREGYEDYQRCRDQLRTCADEHAAGGEIADIETAFVQLSPDYGEILNNRPAKVAVTIAGTYAQRLGSLDPANRYCFKEHAPIIIPLTGRAAVVHEVTMAFLRERLTALSR
jgi:hypothetical protein